MNLLLDTHTFLWFWWNDPKLSEVAKNTIADPEKLQAGQYRKLLGGGDQGEPEET